MKKIPTIFMRDENNRSVVTEEINPECRWVFDGEGVATIKYDGTCCKIDEDGYWKRREVRKGKNDPEGFVLEEVDKITNKRFGWVLVNPNNPEDIYHIDAYRHDLTYGTYELVGPKINGNHEHLSEHLLLKHSLATQVSIPVRDLEHIKSVLAVNDIEGIIFRHPDGRMGKIKKRDFGMKR